MQNGFIERFNRSYREAVLDMFVFQSLSEVREQQNCGLRSTTKNDHTSLGPSDGSRSRCPMNLDVAANRHF